MTRTPARAKTVSFTQPYFETGLCALISNKRAPDVSEIGQLNAEGRILAVKLGTTGDLVSSETVSQSPGEKVQGRDSVRTGGSFGPG